MAEWLESTANKSTANKSTRVTLKKIVVEGDDQLFDFHHVNCFVNNAIDKCISHI